MNNYWTLMGIIVGVVAVLYLMNYMRTPVQAPAPEAQQEGYENKAEEDKEHMTTGYRYGEGNPSPYDGSDASPDVSLTSTQEGCPSSKHLTPNDLLPHDEASTWARMYPSGTGSLKDKNFLSAGHHIGIDTVGQTLRNANLQIRSEPPNPRIMVSPWLNSTIEADTNRRPFELGSC